MNKITLTLQRLARRTINTIALVMLMFVISSCSSDNQDLQDTFDKVRARKGRPIEKIPELKSIPKFVYPSYLKRRDPFSKYIKQSDRVVKKKKIDVNARDLTRRKQGLEMYKVQDLRMVGMLKKKGEIWGLISTPNGVVRKITVGDFIGENFGKVKGISDKGIRIVETVKQKDEWQKRQVFMELDTTNKKTVSHQSIKVEEIVH